MGRTHAPPRTHRTDHRPARRTATAPARRVSGPVHPAHPRPVRAVPSRAPVAAPAAAATHPGALTGRLRALPDHRWLATLLHSRGWIWLLGIALLGIVAMQVSLLKMNAGIGRAVQAGAELEHANAKLEEQVAELSSGERVRTVAAGMGLISPDAGSVGYLTVRPGLDPLRAAQNMTEPSAEARALLSSGGRPPTTSTAASATGAAPTATATTPPATTAATTPVAQVPATTTSEPAAAPTATPAPTAPPDASAGGTVGAAAADGR